jgi:hypothetical protein
MNTTKICQASLRLTVFALPLLLAARLSADASDPPGRVARLSFIKGTVSLQPSGADDWSQASLNYPLTTGDRLYTDQNSQAELEIGSVAVRASATTDLTVVNLNDQFMQLGLGEGTLRVRVYDLPEGDSIEVDTPNGALTLLLPGDYRVETFPDNGTTLVIVNNGSLEVSGGDVSERVESGQAVKLTGTDPIQVSFVSPPAPDDFDQWCWERDRLFTSSNSTAYVNPETPGYYELDTYGVWDASTPYGPVWYPANVPAHWVPYRLGRWIWVFPWGWSWLDGASWGFAPFHFGRWIIIGSRWGWVPGPSATRPYYAPALVAFVGGPNFSLGAGAGGVQGWFPLGPGEPFLPWYHCGGAYLRQVNETNIHDVTNIADFSNLTSINSIHYVNKRQATTAVPTPVFRSGQRVDRQVIPITPEQLAEAEVIPHPEINPTARALGGGKPAPVPPGLAGRATIRATGQRLPPGAAPTSPAGGGMASGPPHTPPRLITKSPPPPANLPFSAQQEAMQAHPGRPLEPQQQENLRAGKPAGPMRDREVPAHPAPAPRAERQQVAPKSEPRPAPPSGSAPKH